MNTGITGIERNIVLNYVINEKVSFLLYSRSDNKNQFILENDFYKIVQQKFLFFTQASFTKTPFADARVRFFYRGRGLYFDGAIKKVSNGFVVAIPDEISKMADKSVFNRKGCLGSLYYLGLENNPIPCVSLEDYPAFLPYKKQNYAKNPSSYFYTVLQRFLNLDPIKESAVQDRIEPIYILVMTNEQIILGLRANTIRLKQNDVYDLQLKVLVGVLRRVITLKCLVSKVYDNKKKNSNYAMAAICDFMDVKIEDQRFLYEQYFNKKFS